jgi:acetoin utilization protein AcuB
MTSAVRTVTPDATYEQALHELRAHKIRRLPVVDSHGAVIGIIAERDLLAAGPSTATTLSRAEMPELLSRVKVRDVMSRPVIMVGPDIPIEEAARLLADHKIGGMPVVDNRRLIGIVTETDLFRTMVDLFGARRKGLRLTFSVEDHRGTLAQLVGEITRQGGSIISIAVFRGADQHHPTIVTKVEDADEERMLAMLRGRGATIVDVRRM